MLQSLKQNRTVLVGLIVFTLVYASISLVNHWLFRTSALDLGLYTNAAWKYAHFMLPDRSLFRWDRDSLFADHMDLHLMLWAPLTYLFGEWTLLIVQIIAIPFGAYGVYKFSLSISRNKFLATIAMFSTLGFYGVFSALAQDFHSNVVACMALPWYFYFLHQRKLNATWWVLVFMLVAKENMGLWLGAVSLAAIGLPYFTHVPRKLLITQGVVAFGWSVLCIGMIMPALDSASTYHQMVKYPVLGSSSGELFETVFTHPFNVFRAFFEDTEGKHPFGTGLKLEFYFIILLSGAWALIRSWPFFLMTLPLLAQKMLHEDYTKWGLFAHYSIEFAVLLPLAIITVILQFRSPALQRTLGGLSLLLTISATLYVLEFPLEHNEGKDSAHDRLRFYQARHYEPYLDQSAIHEAMALIPKNTSVSTAYPFVPHLIEREHLYQFPLGQQSDYILLVTSYFTYPLSQAEFNQEVNKLKSSDAWKLVYDRSKVLLFEKRMAQEP
ncbi:MAG: DUF2079 domain-containing protein [Flavobacteriales bacterium]|nr:DUF2079 domain-containing protein [Flavobacteriales bacterium]